MIAGEGSAACGVGRIATRHPRRVSCRRFANPQLCVSVCLIWIRLRFTLAGLSALCESCRRFCIGQCLRQSKPSTAFNESIAAGSFQSLWKQERTIAINRACNAVRDQGVGGSNPLSPTISYQAFSWTLDLDLRRGTPKRAPTRHFRCHSPFPF